MTDYVDIDLNPNGVTTITMLREDVHNAFDDVMMNDLIRAFATANQDPNTRVIVLRSNGKNFSAGADLNWMRAMAKKNYQQNVDDAATIANLMQGIANSEKPTIALVQGAAFGGAVGLVACCDMAIATPRASFCLSEVKIGLVPAVISPYVASAIGKRQSQRYFLTAERFKADKALEMGLIHEIAEDLDQGAAPLIDALLQNSPAAIGHAKSLIEFVANQPITQAIHQGTIERIATIRVSQEGQEGLNAFLEKRAPSWIKGSDNV